MPQIVFDRSAGLQRRRRAARKSTPGADFLLRWSADEIAVRAGAVDREFGVALDLGGHASPLVAAALAKLPNVGRIVRAEPIAGAAEPPDLVADEELLPLAAKRFGLIVSALQLHAVNDVPGVLAQVRRALRPDGLFLAVVPAGETLFELRESLAAAEAETSGGASPRVAPFADVATLGGLLQRTGFALPVADVDTLTARYADMFALMRDLRAMGETSVLAVRSRRPPPRRLFTRAAEFYRERFGDHDGRIRATFALASLSGWAPHASQQKPLRPGSAAARLADALGTDERPLPGDDDPRR